MQRGKGRPQEKKRNARKVNSRGRVVKTVLQDRLGALFARRVRSRHTLIF